MNIPGALIAILLAGVFALFGWWATTKLGGQWSALKKAM